MKYKLLNKAFLLPVAFALAACAGNAPRPATESGNAPADETATAEAPESQQGEAVFISNSLDNYRLATPEKTPQFGDTSAAIKTPEAAKEQPVDPYTAFPDLADKVFAHTQNLIDAGLPDSATAYLQRFRIIKPLWATWEARTDSILFALGKERADKAKAFEPLVLEIQNMNRAHAAYSMVATSADSLIALTPGDSLVNWANAQKQLAYKNTLSKAKKEYADIKSLAEDKAQFAEALAKANELLLRYRDFDKELHIQELIKQIQDMQQATDAEAIKYWEKNDPVQGRSFLYGISAECGDLVHQGVDIHTVYHSSLFERFALGCGTSETVHSGFHKYRCNLGLCNEDLADRHIFCYCHDLYLQITCLKCLPYETQLE